MRLGYRPEVVSGLGLTLSVCLLLLYIAPRTSVLGALPSPDLNAQVGTLLHRMDRIAVARRDTPLHDLSQVDRLHRSGRGAALF